MTNLREAAQMALDAFDGRYTTPEGRAAIEALRAALANEFNPDWDAMAVMVEEQQRMAKRIEELQERLLQVELNPPTARLAQPEQEPYDQTALELCEVCGWKTLIPDDGCLNCARTGKPVAFWRHSSSVDKGWHEFGAKKTSDKDIPLYTAPPQRDWQGLTVEEIEEAGKESTKSNLLLPYSFARAIEAKLKEKNT